MESVQYLFAVVTEAGLAAEFLARHIQGFRFRNSGIYIHHVNQAQAIIDEISDKQRFAVGRKFKYLRPCARWKRLQDLAGVSVTNLVRIAEERDFIAIGRISRLAARQQRRPL